MKNTTRIPHTIKKVRASYALISGDNRRGKIFRTKDTGLQKIFGALNTRSLSIENARQLIAEINELPIVFTTSKKTDMNEEQYAEFLDKVVDQLRASSLQEAGVEEVEEEVPPWTWPWLSNN